MKINSLLVKTILLFFSLLLISIQGMSLTHQPLSANQQCSSSQQSLRLCTGSQWGNNLEASVALSLCQNKNNPELGSIILVGKTADGELMYKSIIAGTVVIGKHRNINFISKTQAPQYSILFTNDGDETYVTISKEKTGDIADSHTLYCQ